MPNVTIYTDGASRGNPGKASIGVVIKLPTGEVKTISQYLGHKTNNEAEYQAIVEGLKALKTLVGKAKTKTTNVDFYMDSELAQRQLTGIYKLKEPHIQQAFIQIWNLSTEFGTITYNHVRREFNKEADALANKALDDLPSL